MKIIFNINSIIIYILFFFEGILSLFKKKGEISLQNETTIKDYFLLCKLHVIMSNNQEFY